MRTGAIVCQDCGASASNTRAWNTRAALTPAPAVPDTVTGDRSEIDRLIAILRTGRHGSEISHRAADMIDKLATSEFEAILRLRVAPAVPADAGDKQRRSVIRHKTPCECTKPIAQVLTCDTGLVKCLHCGQTVARLELVEAQPVPTPSPQVPTEVLRQVAEGLSRARDLLAERIQGNAARSPGHNARLAVEAALAALQPYVEGV